MSGRDGRAPRLLLVGGGGGFVGRHLLPELTGPFEVRSVHRSPVASERAGGIAWFPGDLGRFDRWAEALEGVDVVVNVAWHRAGPARRFVRLREGLDRCLAAARAAGVSRFVQISVPTAPGRLEATFPYLVEKRRFDAALAESGLSYRILRPTMLYGTGDVLLSVMRRTMARYGVFPMFGDGRYHVSPLAVRDLARIVLAEIHGRANGTVDLGGPRRYEYRELTDLLYRSLRRTPRYWRMSVPSGRRLARLLETFGSHLLYEYEVEWLTSDLLGLPPAPAEYGALQTVEAYLEEGTGVRSGR